MKKLLCLLAVLALLARPLRAEAAPQRYLALTFDDGPSGELTEQLLDGLAERQVHATFFVCAYRIAQFPDTLSHIAAAGHEIGLHSSNHDYMQKMDYETALSDLTRCAKAVEDACGVQAAEEGSRWIAKTAERSRKKPGAPGTEEGEAICEKIRNPIYMMPEMRP